LRLYKTPPRFDEQLSNYALKVGTMLLLAHAAA
jgi:hypothetical protein